jgi:selenide,water dikinase
MCQLNSIGKAFARLPEVKAMTDVTGFGLMGHLTEICEGSGLSAVIEYRSVPKLPEVENYLALGCSPGGAQRNFDSYGHKLAPMSDMQRLILCDPQTSGGLLVAVTPEGEDRFLSVAAAEGFQLQAIGELRAPGQTHLIEVI